MNSRNLFLVLLVAMFSAPLMAAPSADAQAALEAGGPNMVASLGAIAETSPQAATDVIVAVAVNKPKPLLPVMKNLVVTYGGEEQFWSIVDNAINAVEDPATKRLIEETARMAVGAEPPDSQTVERLGEDLDEGEGPDLIGEEPEPPASPS